MNGGGGGAPWTTFLSYSVKVCIYYVYGLLVSKASAFRRKRTMRVISLVIAWLKFLYGLLSIFKLILFVYGTQSPFSICPYKTFLVLDRNNGPE